MTFDVERLSVLCDEMTSYGILDKDLNAKGFAMSDKFLYEMSLQIARVNDSEQSLEIVCFSLLNVCNGLEQKQLEEYYQVIEALTYAQGNGGIEKYIEDAIKFARGMSV